MYASYPDGREAGMATSRLVAASSTTGTLDENSD